MSKSMSYYDIEDILDAKKKTITLHQVPETQSAFSKLIKLAKAFNKTVSFKVWNSTVKITKNTRLKDVFAKCKKIEAARMAHKPSAEDLRGDMREFDDGPYSGFMSG